MSSVDTIPVNALVARSLAAHGVHTVFGVLGDANLFIMEAFVREHGGRYVAASHEAGAVLMACGYASTTGEVGVATVTHGPGLSNTITALVEGVRNRMPVVVVAGDTAVVQPGLQDIAQRELVMPTGAGFEQARAPSTVHADLAEAFRRARTERRPIVFNLRKDFQWEEVEAGDLAPKAAEEQAIGPDAAALDSAVGIVASARRPIVLAGRGATDPRARASLLRLAERIGAPVATTLKAKDLFRDEPCDLGVFGTLSTPPAVEVIVESDCVIAFGASLNRFTTASGGNLADKRVVHCDRDPAALGSLAAADAYVLGDAAVVADTIVEWLDQADVEPSGFRSSELVRRVADYSPTDYKDTSTDTAVDLRTALIAIDEALPRERSVVIDAGRIIVESCKLLHVPEPHSLIVTANFGSIGLATSYGIGAGCGLPGRPAAVVCGDGGFMLGGLVEFNTAVRHGVDLVVFVLNDSSYGAEYIQFEARDMSIDLSMFDWPDFAGVAEALGGRGITVRRPEDLAQLADAIATRDRPLLVDVKIDAAMVPEIVH